MKFVGSLGKGESFRLFGKHVSPAKARFFETIGFDFVPGKIKR